MIRVDGTMLYIENSVLEFSREIKCALEWEDMVVVLLQAKRVADGVNNIYGVQKYKRIPSMGWRTVWQVQDVQHHLLASDEYEYCHAGIYTALNVYPETPDLITATTFGGIQFTIDPKTGLIMGQGAFVK